MSLTRLQKFGVLGVAALAGSALALGTIVVSTRAPAPRRPSAARVPVLAADIAPSTTTIAPVDPVANAGSGQASPAPAAPAADPPSPPVKPADPGVKLDPNLLSKIDVFGPKTVITQVTCNIGSITVYFSASDPSGVTGVFTTFTSLNQQNQPNPPASILVAGIGPDKYSATFNVPSNSTNHFAVTTKDSVGNTTTVGQANLCLV